MPITLKPNQAKYKTSEGYQTLNVLADETTQQKIDQINQIADQRIEQIEQMTDAVVYDVKVDGTSVVNNHIANITVLAKNSDVTELANKLDAVDTQLDQVRSDISDHEDRIEELENAPAPVGGVQDVQVNGTSVVADGVANVPYASITEAGAIRGTGDYAFRVSANGKPYLTTQTAQQYKTETNDWFIGKGTLNNVLATPSIMPALTDEEKASARERIGVDTEVELIADITLEEEVSSITIPINRKYATVYVKIPKSTTTENISCDITFNNDKRSLFNLVSDYAKHSTYVNIQHISVEKSKTRKVIRQCRAVSYDNDDRLPQKDTTNGANEYASTNSLEDDCVLTNFYYRARTKPMLVGTRFVVYASD